MQLGARISEQTLANLQAAIDAHIADESNEPITGAWLLLVETTSIETLGDDDRSGMWVTSRGNNWVTRGMAHEWMYGQSVSGDD